MGRINKEYKIKTKQNCSAIIASILNNKEAKDVYEDLVYKYHNKNITLFSDALQKEFVRLGNAVRAGLEFPTTKRLSNAKPSVWYLCKTVLNDEALYHTMMATDFNLHGNRIKHNLTIEMQRAKIEEMAKTFNRILNSLSSKLNVELLTKYRLINNTRVIDERQTSTQKAYYQYQEYMKKKMGIDSTCKKPQSSISTSTTSRNDNYVNKIKDQYSKRYVDGQYEFNVELLPSDGVITKMGIFGKTQYITFFLNIKANKPDKIKKMDLYIKTSAGKEKLKVELGKKRYLVETSKLKGSLINLDLTIEYRLNKFNESKTTDIKLSRVVD